MATFRKRGAYQWEVRVRRYGYAQVHKTFTSKADADAWAREIETEMDRGVHLSRHEAERTTLRECFERYLQEITPAKKGAKQEGNRIRQLMQQDFANRSMASIRGVDLSEYRDKRILSGLSPYSVNNELIILSHVFTIARTEWGMESLQNPVSDIRRPKLPIGRSRRLSAQEERKLLNGAQTELRAIIIIALETAMREGEIAGLMRSNVDYTIPAVELTDTKNGESRTVPLSTQAVAVLRSLPARIDNRIFGLSANLISKAFHDLCRNLKIGDLRFHDLRHEATSRLFERGLTIMEVAAITGHKTLQMLKRYTHLRACDLAKKLG